METGENVTALNYSAHAIEDMKVIVQRLPPHFVRSVAAIRVVSDMLRRSVKFILPNCAELLDPLHVRIPMKPAIDSETKPATHSDFIPASIPI